MKATARLLVSAAAITATTLVAIDVQAAPRGGGYRGGHAHHGGARHWGGHRYGNHYNRWRPGWSFYYGVPLIAGAAALGWPYYSDYYYPRETVIYREVEREPVYPEGRMEPLPSTEVPRMENAPERGPLYMNYCESARAYFPKVTACPEGWKFLTPAN